jgi:MinD superfamily P-loop ATPase
MMVHAELGIGAENSGKLVSAVRRRAHELATASGRPLLLCDGPPGIGCPVIASITGASMVLVVTEPTVAGEHDLDRVLSLTRHFQICTGVCVNRWDVNPGMTERLEEQARRHGAWIAGRIRFDPGVTRAQMAGQAVVETEAPAAQDLRRLWDAVRARMSQESSAGAARV